MFRLSLSCLAILAAEFAASIEDFRLEIDFGHYADRVKLPRTPAGRLGKLLKESMIGGPWYLSRQINHGIRLACPPVRFPRVALSQLR